MPSLKALAERLKSIDERHFFREKFEVLQNYRKEENIELMFSPRFPGNEPVDVSKALRTLQLSTKPKLSFLDLTLVLDQRLHTEALNVIAESTGALRRFHVVIGRKSRDSWEAIASANQFLEEVTIMYITDDDEDFSAGGQRPGELRTFRVRFG